MAGTLTVEHVREYLSDYPEENLLLDREEMSDTYIELCMELAVSEFNILPPRSAHTVDNFPSMSLLLLATCWQMYQGKAALMARNHLSYSDGGLQIPVEEKYEIYQTLANHFKEQYETAAGRLKIHMNMEDGWGGVFSDEINLPIW